MEQQKVEIAEKRKNFNQSGYHVADIPFSKGSMSTSSGVLEIVRSVGWSDGNGPTVALV